MIFGNLSEKERKQVEAIVYSMLNSRQKTHSGNVQRTMGKDAQANNLDQGVPDNRSIEDQSSNTKVT